MTESIATWSRSMLESAMRDGICLCENCGMFSNDLICKCGAHTKRVDLEWMVKATPYIEYVFYEGMNYQKSDVSFEINGYFVSIDTEERTLKVSDRKYGYESVTVLLEMCEYLDRVCKDKFFERMRRIASEVDE